MLGHTASTVEHGEETVRAAGYIIEPRLLHHTHHRHITAVILQNKDLDVGIFHRFGQSVGEDFS